MNSGMPKECNMKQQIPFNQKQSKYLQSNNQTNNNIVETRADTNRTKQLL